MPGDTPPPLPAPPALPLWIRALLALERGPHALARAAALLRDELLLALVPPGRRDAVNAALLARQRTYSAGGATFEGGLFDWERALLTRPEVPRRGRVLVGGAGGGREMRALRAMGYEVVGLEPVEALARDAAALVAGDAGALVLRGAYADLVRAAAGGAPALAREAAACDLVLLGWGSLVHVRGDGERRALVRALRALAPSAPVLVTFDDFGPPDPPGSGRAAVRAVVRRLLAAVGAPARARDDERFLPWAGFLRGVSEREVRALAAEAGYAVAWLGTPPGRAVLVPTDDRESEERPGA